MLRSLNSPIWPFRTLPSMRSKCDEERHIHTLSHAPARKKKLPLIYRFLNFEMIFPYQGISCLSCPALFHLFLFLLFGFFFDSVFDEDEDSELSKRKSAPSVFSTFSSVSSSTMLSSLLLVVVDFSSALSSSLNAFWLICVPVAFVYTLFFFIRNHFIRNQDSKAQKSPK